MTTPELDLQELQGDYEKLKAVHARLRKAAEDLKEEGTARLTAEHSALISMGAEFMSRWKKFCAALAEEGK